MTTHQVRGTIFGSSSSVHAITGIIPQIHVGQSPIHALPPYLVVLVVCTTLQYMYSACLAINASPIVYYLPM